MYFKDVHFWQNWEKKPGSEVSYYRKSCLSVWTILDKKLISSLKQGFRCQTVDKKTQTILRVQCKYNNAQFLTTLKCRAIRDFRKSSIFHSTRRYTHLIIFHVFLQSGTLKLVNIFFRHTVCWYFRFLSGLISLKCCYPVRFRHHNPNNLYLACCTDMNSNTRC